MNRRLRTLLFASILLLFGMPVLGAETIPANLTGQYGFDWLNLKKFKCTPITESTRSLFKSCKYSGPGATGSFSGKTDFTTCRVSEKSEYMIYKTKARCDEELEIMRANE